MDLGRLLLVVANLGAAVLALALWLAPLKVQGAHDTVLVFFVILFLVDALCVVPPAWIHRP